MLVLLPSERACNSTSFWFSLTFKFLLLQILQFLRIILCVEYITVIIIDKVRMLDSRS